MCTLDNSGRTPGACRPGGEKCAGCGFDDRELERRKADIRAGRNIYTSLKGLRFYWTGKEKKDDEQSDI